MKRIFLALALFVSVTHLSCSLNPLNGLLTDISVHIDSVPGGFQAKKASMKNDVHISAVPSTQPTEAGDFDCVAFSVTGYGIDEKVNVPGNEMPLERLRLGLETPMQPPSVGPQYSVQVPSLLGVDPRLQKRLVQIYGVYTSLADKTSCQGKALSDFLVNDDPYAAVYVIGSGYYPSEDSLTCGSENCIIIEDAISRTGAGNELIYAALFINQTIYPDYAFSFTTPGTTIFSDSDLYSGGNLEGVNGSIVSKPFSINSIARVDYYFPLSDFLRERISAEVRFRFTNIQAPEYNISGATCSSTASGVYSDVRFKIWDAENRVWMNPPRLSGSGDLDISPANTLNGTNYTIYDFDLSDSSIQTEVVYGKSYLIVSLRSLVSSCSSLQVGPAYISFP